MKERCEDCKGLEEEIYWKYFQSMHFCQLLTGDFRCRLIIPQKFSEKVGANLSQKLGLRGPSGRNWDVQLVRTGDLLYFGDGWGEFVDAHSLAEKDILVFKYTGNSQFDVLMFEGSNLCVKESSYFVRKCGHTKETEDKSKTAVARKECSVEIIQDQEHSCKDFVSTPVQNARKGKQNRDFSDKQNGMKKAFAVEPEDACVEHEVRGRNPYGVWETVKLPGSNSKQMPLRKVKNTTHHRSYASNRRAVTEAEKVAALQLASKEVSESSFLVVMRATHVYKRFYLYIPLDWMIKHMVREKQDVILRTKERSWSTTLTFSTNGHGGISRGWRNFAADNRLEEFDVCVFKLVSQKETPVVLDVTIFRVVPEVGPPTPLTPEPSSSQGASAINKRKFCVL